MPKSEREETLAALTARVFAAMLDELVMDATLQSHREVLRARSVCSVCNTQCGSIHNSASAANNEGTSQASASGQRGDTPSSSTGSNDANATKTQANGTGTSTPTSLKGANGELLLECVSCSRTMAPNRLAPHLTSCMGFNNARRGAVRGNAKPKQPSEAGRSASPMSDAGNMSDDRTNGNGKGKGKAKGKKTADESDFTLKRKRPGSPQISPNKKSKKGSPVMRVKADPDLSGLPTNSHYSPSTTSQSKVPSKLRDSSTASFLERSSASSRDSSPEAAYTAVTPSSSFSSQSPNRPIGGSANRGRPPAMGTGPPKRPTPPRPQPIHVPDYHIEIDHANETGSSTDTDSD
ncbi:hypothetical protein GALMADRAFT_289033 [Galerina marginata CBS 339.88]|uniref:SAGA-associated factor 11 n=1 Tax=Galerina marginata (strain CBS 339.88) TaxID=685588 RepID=A0A067TNM1_GALM3|nr:hypothetical protein GALMADRAFT_289033 [Galerina marginata CBS 339.88]